MGATPPELSLPSEERALLEARFVAHHEPQRTWPFYAITMALCAGLWALTLIPAFDRAFGVTPSEMAVVALAMMLAITAATVSAHLPGGVASKRYRIADGAESAVLAACAASLIYMSGGASTIFWLITVLLLLHNSPEMLTAPFLRWAHAVALAVVAALFLAQGLVADAVAVAFFAVVLFFLARTQEQTGRRFLQLQAERDALGRKVEALLVEQERERIARDLHDGLGAELAALAWTADALALDGEGEGKLSEISQRARAGLSELRRFVTGLEARPMPLAELARTIERDAQKLVPKERTLRVLHAGDAALTGVQCVQLGLMVREAVHNAIRHGDAGAITVRLEQRERTLHLQIHDDGSGVAAESVQSSRSGIKHFGERAALLGGTAEISGSSEGTTVRVAVPLAQ